jgi:hypothetical protein
MDVTFAAVANTTVINALTQVNMTMGTSPKTSLASAMNATFLAGSILVIVLNATTGLAEIITMQVLSGYSSDKIMVAASDAA